MDLIYNLFPQMQKNKWDIKCVFTEFTKRKQCTFKSQLQDFVSLLKEAILS